MSGYQWLWIPDPKSKSMLYFEPFEMQILTRCWEAEEVVMELTEVLQFNKFIRWILKFKMFINYHLNFLCAISLLAGSYDESGPANRVSYDATVANLQSRWADEHSLTCKASYLFARVQLSRVTSLQPFSPDSLPNQLDIFSLVRLSALEDGAGIDYNYNNYEHAAAASDHNSDVVSYGTWTKRQTRLNKTAAKFCHFYHTFQKAFKSTKTVLTYPLVILETHDWTINQPCRSFSIFCIYSVLLLFLS